MFSALLNREVKQFYRERGHLFFEKLYRQVNRQALAPFFRPWLRQEGAVLDAGAGSGHLALELGLRNACFLDLTWEQIKWFHETGTPGRFMQGDLHLLPFRDNVFDKVICSNVLHYTGLVGLKELLRVAKPGGQLLLAFLEASEFTRSATRLAVIWGLFPPLMRDARFIELTDLFQLDIQIADSATIVFLPPFFLVSRRLPRQGLVAFALKKGRAQK